MRFERSSINIFVAFAAIHIKEQKWGSFSRNALGWWPSNQNKQKFILIFIAVIGSGLKV